MVSFILSLEIQPQQFINKRGTKNLHFFPFDLLLLLWCFSGKSGDKEQAKKQSKLLDGSSEFVLTYEDREGDWMLVGDVPWGYVALLVSLDLISML